MGERKRERVRKHKCKCSSFLSSDCDFRFDSSTANPPLHPPSLFLFLSHPVPPSPSFLISFPPVFFSLSSSFPLFLYLFFNPSHPSSHLFPVFFFLPFLLVLLLFLSFSSSFFLSFSYYCSFPLFHSCNTYIPFLREGRERESKRQTKCFRKHYSKSSRFFCSFSDCVCFGSDWL